MAGGVLVDISNLRILGARPDGSAAPRADLIAIVDFDPVAAGCNVTNGYCTPGAEIKWYLNGQLLSDTVASGYDGSLGGYSVSTKTIIAPDSGVVQITAKSLNQLDADVTVASTGAEPGEGLVSVAGIYCGNSPDFNCSCESSGQLIVYFDRVVTAAGSGTAYVDVFVDGVLKKGNVPTSTQGGRGTDSVALSCPNLKVSHTILVKGKKDVGASIVLNANTPAGQNYKTPLSKIGPYDSSNTNLGPITGSQTIPRHAFTLDIQPSSGVSEAQPCEGMSRNGNFDLSCIMEPANQMWLVAGVVVIGLAGVAAFLLKDGDSVQAEPQ